MTIGLYSLALAAIGLVSAAPASAEFLSFSAPATETAALVDPMASYALPVAAWDGSTVPSRVVEGALERRAWRLDEPGASTLALLTDLRAQLLAEGFEVLFQCETAACGGFDFRYSIDLVPEPHMHVDLGDFRFLAMARGDEVLGLMVSRSSASAFVQMTRVGPAGTLDAAPPATLPPTVPGDTAATPAPGAVPASDVPSLLARGGGVVLEDLRFEAGASALAPGEYPSLVALAGWLAENPERRVALVGHTDAAGGLEMNTAISRKRAEAVRNALIGDYGVPAAQVTAEGVGFLAPRATNATDEGRALNRRVEAVAVTGG